MWFPIVLLAGLCVLFGVFARQIPLGVFIYPSLNQNAVFSGTWSAGVATVLILLGIFVGVVIYLLGMAGKSRTTAPFIELAQKKVFDIYEVGVKGVQWLYGVLRYFHNGILPTYLSWCLLGMLALFYILLK